MRSRQPLRAVLLAALATVATGAMLASGLTVANAAGTGPVTLQQRTSSVVTADPLATVQIDNGYVWAQAMIGNTVYAGGGFANARAPLASPGTSLTPRSNILAYDIRTGNLLSFAPQVNGPIRAVAASPDGTRLYIGGSFTSVNGQTRFNFAALNPTTGALLPGFNASIGGAGVFGIATMNDTVYVTGRFTQANGVARQNLAAFATANGALRSWAPTIDLQGDALVIDPGGSHVIAGGRFYRTNGVVQRGLAPLDPVTGALDTAWAASKTVINGWSEGDFAGKAGIFSLNVDDSGVYGTGWVYANTSIGNLEGTFAAEAGTGAIRWVADCHGDHYGVYSTGDVVYTTSHTHACDTAGLAPELNPRTYRYVEAFTATAEGTLTRSPTTGSIYKDWSGTPAPAPYAWYPDFTIGRTSGLNQAGLSMTGNGQYLSIGGEFTSVNNLRYEGLVRFSTTPPNGPKQGPRIASATWGAPTVTSVVAGRARISIRGNWDRDDRDLTYELRRAGTAGVIRSQVVPSGWWSQPQVTFNDTGLTPGTTQSYTVRVVDGNGNAVTSQAATVTVASGQTSAYANAVLDDGATLYYPLGSNRSDWGGTSTPLFGSGATDVSPGAVAGVTGESASSFNGTTSGRVSSGSSSTVPGAFSTELWFNTTTTQGGKLMGFGSAQTGSSSSYDRHVYMQNSGRLTFGVYPGQVRTISSTASYNDGRWHHVVATQGAGGIALYVDGTRVAQDTTVTTAQGYTGFWRIGGDNLGSWPSAPSSSYFRGAIDEVAVYSAALSSSQVSTHYAVGSGQQAPTAAFQSTTSALTASFDASGSTAASGSTIASYAWQFGDGATGTGVSPSHAYSQSGTYGVTLTVTDSRGLSDAITQNVTVQAANVGPTASFTSTVSDLDAAVNGSGSSDPDGSVVAWSWNWGDGTASTSGATSTHRYGAAGSYTVTLTVTDDDGATATTTRVVQATEPDVPPPATFAARDDFSRTVASGWGTSDVGGPWTITGTATPASVGSGLGTLSLGAGSTRDLRLSSLALSDVRVSMDLRLDQAPATGSAYVGVITRSTSAGDYRVRVWLRDNGTVWLVVQHGSTVLRSYQVPGIARAAGDWFTLEVEVTGSTSTTVDASIWRAGTPRPAAWQVSVTDATGSNPQGSVGVHANRSSTATSTGLFSIDAFRVTNLG
ncbi:PKD domain-containing protein [Agrococcus jenensis]|uniref:PKD domain-containing protein n=1 Tax=Agrococcus jenensis TaxID=46353 RepID=A0A3N2AWI9_9MICO|nr:PKD domain-containing protein [Agrococcus jenensis]ROR67374.1 PKD domain-containing protein [Agrococcus jenensis]